MTTGTGDIVRIVRIVPIPVNTGGLDAAPSSAGRPQIVRTSSAIVRDFDYKLGHWLFLWLLLPLSPYFSV